MTEATARRCLLLFPKTFYSFAKVLAGGLEQRGYEVVTANEEYPENVFGKILGKLGLHGLLAWTTERAISRRFLAGRNYELAVIVKGRGLGRRLIERLRSSGTRVVAYNFDSFGYNPAPLRWYKDVDRYATFDYADAETYGLPRVDLFSSLPEAAGPKEIRYDVSAILRNHSDRLQYLDSILRALEPQRTFLFVFEQNVFTFVLNILRSPRLYAKYWRHISFKPLPYAQYAAVLRSSEYTVDYAHPQQTGITIRCFESLSAQTKVITNNPSVTRNPAFEQALSIVYRGASDDERLRQQYAAGRGRIPPRRHRSVADFIVELVDA
jgi:hypothetical protein